MDLLKGIDRAYHPEILDSGIRTSIKAKKILFHEGDVAQRCYLVIKGSLKLTKLNEQGREIIIRYIGPTELTAEVAVLKEKKYPVTAEALKKTDVISWDKQTMLQLMRKYPDIAINMIDIVFKRIDDVQFRYLELSTEPVEQRIARTLMRLMRQYGKKTKEGVCIDIPLSRQNIADYCSTTHYTVSRILSLWGKRSLIISRREQVTITEPHAIGMIADEE
ncbi:Crp/Fnr family transcriptional regulator [Desulfococcaceae bacterium HSG8]|nr:Crp/Fnr family transcriptional regulator [Desulfococcaceae bacterium HSG8]